MKFILEYYIKEYFLIFNINLENTNYIYIYRRVVKDFLYIESYEIFSIFGIFFPPVPRL